MDALIAREEFTILKPLGDMAVNSENVAQFRSEVERARRNCPTAKRLPIL